MLIRYNHRSPELYGLGFFKEALKEINESIKEHMKAVATALRVAYYAKDGDFFKFIKDEEEMGDDELLCR